MTEASETFQIDTKAFQEMLTKTRQRLLASRNQKGYWEGNLSSSALSTATAVTALAVVDRRKYQSLIEKGLVWMTQHVNPDGGWGDSIKSNSNISTTLLCWSAFAAAKESENYRDVMQPAESWIQTKAGTLETADIVEAIYQRYGRDRTFSVPILTMAAISGRLGEGKAAWQWVKALPFELAAFPQRVWRWLRLPVVSYALPALIAMGHVRFKKRPPANPLTRMIRYVMRNKTLDVLKRIQPENGGFLEAPPLTSFVVMSLAAAGYRKHEVVRKGVEFLVNTVREDGSWPIDTNLATWLTTLSINALANGDGFNQVLPQAERETICHWLLSQQYRIRHPYTGAAPGGWAWTDLPGGVPDADDSAGALLALYHLEIRNDKIRESVEMGIRWLLGVQNLDGGFPTFCRGWGKLPFDRSCADITAHAIKAMSVWSGAMPTLAWACLSLETSGGAPKRRLGVAGMGGNHRIFEVDGVSDGMPTPFASLKDRLRLGMSVPNDLKISIRKAIQRGINYLIRIQNKEGYWLPLWFGNQWARDEENRTYGTAKVILGLVALYGQLTEHAKTPLRRGIAWLLRTQNEDGGWGGDKDAPASIEETALALEALAGYHINRKCVGRLTQQESEKVNAAMNRGISWLTEHTKQAKEFEPAPIGFYFAKLWYYEELYPVIFTLASLEKILLEHK